MTLGANPALTPARARSIGAACLLAGLWCATALCATTDEDCDHDGVPDANEIRAVAEADFNENGHLDRCEQRDGDIDLSGEIDFGDVAWALLDLGSSNSVADLNGDDSVDFLDVALVLMEYGRAPRTNAARVMLADLIFGRSHLDFLVLGDSNATYSNAGSRGFAGGLFDELTRRGVPLFGTGLLPTAASGTRTVYPLMGLTGEGRTAAASITVHDVPRVNDGWMRGSLSNMQLERFTLGSPTLPLKLEGFTVDWALLPEGAPTGGHPREWIGLAPNPAGSVQFGSRCPGAFRVLAARFRGSVPDAPRAPLLLRLAERSTLGPEVVPAVACPTTPDLDAEMVSFESHYPADPARGTLFASHAAPDGSAGPIGVLLRSLYRRDRVPGFAITVLQNLSGGTTSQIASSIMDDVGCGIATLRTYLREMRTRQIEAGGRGRVLVFINMGINNGSQPNAEETCASDSVRMVAQLDRAWASLGYPPEDLGFLLTASHDGGVATYRADLAGELQRRSLAGDDRLALLNIDQLAPREFLSSGRLFTGNTSQPDAHLSAEGYRVITEQLFERLLRGRTLQPE